MRGYIESESGRVMLEQICAQTASDLFSTALHRETTTEVARNKGFAGTEYLVAANLFFQKSWKMKQRTALVHFMAENRRSVRSVAKDFGISRLLPSLAVRALLTEAGRTRQLQEQLRYRDHTLTLRETPAQ